MSNKTFDKCPNCNSKIVGQEDLGKVIQCYYECGVLVHYNKKMKDFDHIRMHNDCYKNQITQALDAADALVAMVDLCIKYNLDKEDTCSLEKAKDRYNKLRNRIKKE